MFYHRRVYLFAGLTRAGVRVDQEAQTMAVVTAMAQIDMIAMEVGLDWCDTSLWSSSF